MVFWHIAGAGYQEGDDLLSFRELLARGLAQESDWRWEHPLGSSEDWQCVSLFSSAADALEWLEAEDPASDAYTILRVDLAEDYPGLFWHATEQHYLVEGEIPAQHLDAVSLDVLRASARQQGDE